MYSRDRRVAGRESRRGVYRYDCGEAVIIAESHHLALHRLRGAALALNSSESRRPPMDPMLRQQLLQEMAPEIRELADLIHRDLSGWLETPVPRAA